MAVPKKRTSKAKRNTRRTLWKQKIYSQIRKSFSLASSILNKQMVEKKKLHQEEQ
jgi:ribosomal protein L32